MKVAVSLPDPVFAAAEQLAQRMRVSRSQLYARALEEYVAQRQDTRVTERLDAVYAATGSALDPAIAKAQSALVGDEAW